MHILLISHFQLNSDLTSHRSVNFGKFLVRSGHQVTHISISPKSRFTINTGMCEGMQTIETPDLFWGRGRSGWDPWDTLLRILKLNSSKFYNIDIIHGFECRPVTIFPIMARKIKRNGVPFISDWEDWWGRGGLIEENRPNWYRHFLGPVETYFEEAFRHKADGVTVISTALKERALKLGVEKKNLCKIPGGVDISRFKSISKNRARKAIGIRPSKKVAVFSAMVLIDLELALSAFSIVCQQFPDALLILTGRKSAMTQKIIAKYKLDKNVLEVGIVPLSEYPNYLASADVCLLPFKNKIANVGRWPNKLGEYMAMGKPVVSNPVGEVNELFRYKKIGLLAGENPSDFSAGVISLFENPELCEEMGQNGRHVAKEYYAWPLLIERLERFYHQYI